MSPSPRARRIAGILLYLVLLSVLVLTPSPTDLIAWMTVAWIALGLLWMYERAAGPASRARRAHRHRARWTRDLEEWAERRAVDRPDGR